MIRALTAAKAAEIFKGEFWDRLRCDEMPPKTAIVVYDAAVNTGRGQSVKFLQRTLGFTGKDVDGLIGPKTIAATQDFTGPDLMLAYGCIEQRERFYADLTNSKPALSKFLKGWLNRCRDLRKFISDIQL
jgi:lysozyme family protein